uniref:Uncharacterized protein n=1 Tax=Aegilops tauschii subsp. strangulata TaxID=200361 RepID=A0A452YYE2_AEGTS
FLPTFVFSREQLLRQLSCGRRRHTLLRCEQSRARAGGGVGEGLPARRSPPLQPGVRALQAAPPLRHRVADAAIAPARLLPSVASRPRCCCHLRRAPDRAAARESAHAVVSCCPLPARAADAAFDVYLSGQTHSSVSSAS